MKKFIIIFSMIFGVSLFSISVAQQIDPPSLQLDAGPADTSAALTPRLQRALEVDSVADHLQGIVVLCANACEEKSTSVRKPMQDLKSTTAPREKVSGMATGRRQHKPLTLTKRVDKATPLHDTAKASISNMKAMTCTGSAQCVDMIARNNSCKVGTVSCTGAGCTCEKP